jgi:hypothetical protein
MQHVACRGQKRKVQKIWKGNSNRYHLEDLGIYGSTLKWILNKQDWIGQDYSCSGWDQVAGSIKCREFPG